MPFKKSPLLFSISSLMLLASTQASAANLHSSDDSELNLNVEMAIAAFNSEKSYNTLGARSKDESATWREGYLHTGLEGYHSLASSGAIYGNVSVITSATWGDGDAAGISTGDEGRSSIENAYLGWRSGNAIEALGENGLDISFGRQRFTLGDGFILANDALNVGSGFGENLNRGGAYYLAARQAFDKTLIVRVGGEAGLRADLFKVESDNRIQGEPTFTGVNVEYVTESATWAVAYFETESDGKYANPVRDGQETYSVRYQGNAGVENLFLSTEWVRQQSGMDDVDTGAGYVEAGWTFANAEWSPSVNYRFSTFDDNYDPLNYGFTRGFGTWYQGEVAANYAGPLSTNTDVHHIGIKASVTDTLALGLNAFQFDTQKKALGNRDAQEFNLYAEYFLNDYMMLSPLVGFYTPDASSDNGGSQIGDNDTNIYAQAVLFVFY